MEEAAKDSVSIDPLSQEQLVGVINEQLTGFVRYARENRYQVGLRETLDCHRLATKIGLVDKARLKHSLKGLMCSNADDWERYDRLFDLYWQYKSGSDSSRVTMGGSGTRDKSMPVADQETQGSQAGGQFDVPDAEGIVGADTADGRLSQDGASSTESLERTNFKQLNNAAELRQMEELAELLAKRIRRQVLRRMKNSERGRRIDMRRTIRHSLQHGGDPLQLRKRARHIRVPKLVIMLDVSRSMSVYSYLFLRFARGILSAFKDADAFAFHTRLQHIGETLREQSRVKLVEKMDLISFGWGGGTRLDSSLLEFNQRYARNVLNRRTVFVIVSDGYDTGDPDYLVHQLERIQSQVRRIVWVNPLLGQESYTPSTKSMQAALPLIDVFAPGHNLESLAALEVPLSRL